MFLVSIDVSEKLTVFRICAVQEAYLQVDPPSYPRRLKIISIVVRTLNLVRDMFGQKPKTGLKQITFKCQDGVLGRLFLSDRPAS